MVLPGAYYKEMRIANKEFLKSEECIFRQLRKEHQTSIIEKDTKVVYYAINNFRLMPDAGIEEILNPDIEIRISKDICSLCNRNSESNGHEKYCNKNAGSMSLRHN